MELLARDEIAHLEAEQAIDVHETERLPAIDGERPNRGSKRADLLADRVRGGVSHAQQRGLESRQIGMLAVKPVNGVVRAGLRHHLRDDLAAERVNDVPMILFERREIHHAPIRRQRHAVAAALIRFFPEDFVRAQIEAGEELQRAHVKPPGRRAGRDAFYVERLAVRAAAGSRNAPHERVATIDVEHEHTVAAALEIIPNPRRAHIQQPARRGIRRRGRTCGQRVSAQRGGDSGAEKRATRLPGCVVSAFILLASAVRSVSNKFHLDAVSV
jgi:hypothetical protein